MTLNVKVLSQFQTCFNGTVGGFSEKAGCLAAFSTVGEVISMEGCRDEDCVVEVVVSFVGRYEKPGMKIFAVAGVVGLLSL